MRKSISKTDKKKKKELAEQTDKMEQELQKRHAEELNVLTAQLEKDEVSKLCIVCDYSQTHLIIEWASCRLNTLKHMH